MKPVSPHRLHLARTPTPIQKLSSLSAELSGPEIFVKRDDLTGLGLSGNKVRKLEYCIAEALEQECDSLITTGGIGSNHARATAVAARQLGLDPFLLLRGQREEVPDGNYFLDSILGATTTFITAEQYPHNEDIMADMAAELSKKGKRPYVIPEGASNEIGAWGYYTTAKEIHEQILQENLPDFDAIIVATGSGGTQAGLLLGLQYYQMDIPVYGINVCDDEEYFRLRISRIMELFADRYSYPLPVPFDQINMIDGYVGEGYALSRPDELDTIRLVARREGIFLDPVYTGKAMHGLIGEIGKERFRKGMNLLFIHTGGIFGLFPARGLFARHQLQENSSSVA